MLSWFYKILLVHAAWYQVAFAQSPTVVLDASEVVDEKNAPTSRKIAEPLHPSTQDPETFQGPRVRIGLRLTSFIKVVQRESNGQQSTRFVPAEPIRHTLKARINGINHFFVSDWHIETKPLKWIKKTGRYDTRLTFFRRYGAFGQLEESVGSVDLAGTLDLEKDQVYVLIGVVRQRLRDKLGSPYLDVVAGFSPPPPPPPKVFDLSKVDRRPPPGPAEPPPEYSGELIRGRF